jgi:xanthine dehydrogenase/oxidase
MVDFRRTVSLSFFFKFFLKVNSHLAEGLLNASELSLLEDHEWSEVSSGSQSFSTYPEKAPVGDPVIHVNSLKQVSGQAVYASDIPLMVGELHACYVYSTKAHAKILSIDAQPALNMAGVVDFITAKDIPGRNIGGMPHLPDELLFAENEVHAIGQVIGAVIAADAVTARLASRAVKIQYEELSATTQLRQAIEAKAFDSKPRTFKFGDPDAAWAQCDHVIEGEVSNGEQNHFYLETHSCVAYPGEDKEITIIAGVQGLADPTRTIAQILNIPINRIEMKVKRLGGAFGGKETRGTHPAATCAVAARKCKRPVRMVMDRDDSTCTIDMFPRSSNSDRLYQTWFVSEIDMDF